MQETAPVPLSLGVLFADLCWSANQYTNHIGLSMEVLMDSNRKIVLIGGGIASLVVIRSLEKKIGSENLILVEPKDYFEIPIGVLRGLMDPEGFARRIRKPWSELTAARHIVARATEISGDEVILSNGDRLAFEQAIVATGATTKGYPFIKGGGAETAEARDSEFRSEGARLKGASSVLIIGGGPIGVELAGEINSAHTAKQITIVDGQDRLLPALPPGAGKKAHKVLTSRGITVALNIMLEPKGDKYMGSDGTIYSADIVYNAIGIRTDAIPVDGGESMNKHGQLKVDDNLRVNGRINVFAIGDVNDVPEIKLAATVRTQAGVAAGNVVALRGSNGAPLRSYRASKPMGFVTFGRKGGIAQLPFGRMDFMIGMKQKDMLTSMYLK